MRHSNPVMDSHYEWVLKVELSRIAIHDTDGTSKAMFHPEYWHQACILVYWNHVFEKELQVTFGTH